MTCPLISVALPPTLETPELAPTPRSSGYERVWLYDTPALQLDVWMSLALCATRTRAHRTRHGGARAQPAARARHRVGDRSHGRAGARPDRLRLRHRLHRPDGARPDGAQLEVRREST